MAIDINLSSRGLRPDNVYRLVEKVSKSTEKDVVMCYGSIVTTSQKVMRECADHVEKLNFEVVKLKKELQQSKKQLHSAQIALQDATNQTQELKRQRNVAQKKVSHYRNIKDLLKEDIAELQEENSDLSKALSAVEHELLSISEKTSDSNSFHDNFTIQTKFGRRYSPTIRKLYYTLLANQIPASKISDIIKTVVKSFNSSIDVDQLKLPQKDCASYMRKDELKTVSAAHKATVLCEQTLENKVFKLHTDGTTKGQKKLGGVAINDTVISVNELPDGTAETAVADISGELEKLRKIAHDLKIPNADSINWTLIVSSNSDSAAMQKKLNRLIEDCRRVDEVKFGPASSTAIELIEVFCSMHLAVNLRKAFLNGISHSTISDRYHPLDTLVHEFCKLFGRCGVPEYGCGVTFTDFLSMMSSKSSLNEQTLSYYQFCTKISLDRQVGSRYFVTAANATKIVYLREAAIEFLKYMGKENGTKLEKDVYEKLQDCDHLAFLKVDALMFYHIYADLVMLSKSTDLKKSVLDMNQHYHELKLFLEEVEHHPEVIMERKYSVFQSEERLYADNNKVNHRYNPISEILYAKLFSESSSDLFPFLIAGATKMREKLSEYAKSNLPGGIYWDPSDIQVKNILSELKPSNDFCEAILGLNDYLTTALPNLHQVARSNLIETKKNKSLKWLSELPDDKQLKVINLAVERRQAVHEECKQMAERIAMQKRERMINFHTRQEALKKKLKSEKDELSQMHLITCSEELHAIIADIDKSSLTAAKKRNEKRTLLMNQVKIRKKILEQNIQIKFSFKGRQRPLPEIFQELCDFIDQDVHEMLPFIRDPSTLIGKRICHKFELELTNELKWYCGTVFEYDSHNKTYTILYDGEEDHCFFDLTLDLLIGDIKVLDI